MAERRICYSELCMLGWPAYTPFKDGKWSVNVDKVNRLYCAAANGGATMQRIMPWTVWSPHPEGMKSQFSPYVLEGDKFNISRFNDYYFPIVRQVIRIAKSYGIKTWFCLADNCQFHGDYRKWSPWVSNVQGISSIYDGFVGANGAFKNSYLYFDMFVDRSLVELSADCEGFTGGNEMNTGAFRSLANAVLFPYLKSGRLKFSKMTYGATMDGCDQWGKDDKGKDAYLCEGNSVQDLLKKDVGGAFGEKEKLAIWKEVHGIGGVEPNAPPPHSLHQALFWWGNHPIKVWLSDDGTWKGDSQCDFEADTGRRRPSYERWGRVVKHCLTYRNSFIFEHLPKSYDSPIFLDCQQTTLSAMYKAVFGKAPEKKYHYNPLPPEPPAPTEVEVTVCPESGLLPTEWCPIKETRKFKIGQEPTAYCRVHYKPCSYFIKRWNIWGWIRCWLLGKH